MTLRPPPPFVALVSNKKTDELADTLIRIQRNRWIGRGRFNWEAAAGIPSAAVGSHLVTTAPPSGDERPPPPPLHYLGARPARCYGNPRAKKNAAQQCCTSQNVSRQSARVRSLSEI